MKMQVKVEGASYTLDFDDFEQIIDGLWWRTKDATYIGSAGGGTVMKTRGGRYFVYHYPIRYAVAYSPASIQPIDEDTAARLIGEHDPERMRVCFPDREIGYA